MGGKFLVDIVHGLLVGMVASAFTFLCKDSSALLDLGGVVSYLHSLVFWYRSGVTPGLPQEWLSDSEWGLVCDAVPFCEILRNTGPLREGQWKIRVLKIPEQGTAECYLLATEETRLLHPREHASLRKAIFRHVGYVLRPEKCVTCQVVLQVKYASALFLRSDAMDHR